MREKLKNLIEAQHKTGIDLVMLQALEKAHEMGDNDEMTITVSLKITKEDGGCFAADGTGSVKLSNTEKHKIELLMADPNQPDLFDGLEDKEEAK